MGSPKWNVPSLKKKIGAAVFEEQPISPKEWRSMGSKGKG